MYGKVCWKAIVNIYCYFAGLKIYWFPHFNNYDISCFCHGIWWS